jgi:hypothetical protein
VAKNLNKEVVQRIVDNTIKDVKLNGEVLDAEFALFHQLLPSKSEPSQKARDVSTIRIGGVELPISTVSQSIGSKSPRIS